MTDVILQGDVRSCLKQLDDVSVQCVITSPPYWGLRDYGCDGQIGLEPTPEAYVADLVEVFHEVKRVLRNDGVLWLNLGDSYASDTKGSGGSGIKSGLNCKRAEDGSFAPDSHAVQPFEARRVETGLAPKNLVGIPWMVAFALRADGWYLRQDIIWEKPGPMPESVTDRCTKSHEYIFLLVKSGDSRLWVHRDHPYKDCVYVEPEPDYRWWNNDTKEEVAIEPAGWRTMVYILAGKELPLWTRHNLWRGCDYYYDNEAIKEESITGDPRTPYGSQGAWDMRVRPAEQRHGGQVRESVKRGGFNGKTNEIEGREAFRAVTETRNKRDVWTVATQPCAEAHFATFPPKLIEPMILAGTKEGDTILDPFMGSGTTAIQAVRWHRHYLGCELNPDYVKMAERRIADMVGPLFEVTA